MKIIGIVLRVVVAALVVGCLPLVAAPIYRSPSASRIGIEVFPPREISPRRIGATDGSQGLQAVASDGEQTYVVWMLNRTAFVSTFDRDGAFVSEHRIGDGFRTAPSITWDGRRLVLGWSSDEEILVSPLTEELELETEGGLRVADGLSQVNIVSSSSGYLVAWTDRFDISAAVLDPELSVIATYSRLAREVTWPSLATDGEGFVIVWSDIYPFPEDAGVHALLISSGETPGAPISVVVGEERSYPAVAWNGQAYLVTWGHGQDLRGAVLERGGVREPFSVCQAPTGGVEASSLSWNGREFLVAFDSRFGVSAIPEAMDGYHLYSCRLNAEGAMVGDVVTVSSRELASLGPSSIWNGERWFLSWTYVMEGIYYGVRASPVTADGEVVFANRPVPGIAVSRGPHKQSGIDLARGDHSTLAVWYERLEDDGTSEVRIGRIGTKGEPLDGEGQKLATGAGGMHIGCGWSRCLGVFASADVPKELGSSGIYAMWVAKNGVPMTDRYLLAANTSARSDVVSDGDTFAFTLGNQLALLRPDWYYAVPLPFGALALGSHRVPVASNGNGFLVAWSLFDSPRGTFVARVGPDGVLATTRKVNDNYSEYLALASDGEGYLLVSSLNDITTKGNDLKGQRFDGSGNPVGARFDVISAAGHQSLPAVGWDGVQYVVTWVVAGGLTGPLEVGRVTRDGRVLDGLPGAAIRLADTATFPVIDVDPVGRTIISYEAPIESPYESVGRIHYLLIDAAPSRGRGVRRP